MTIKYKYSRFIPSIYKEAGTEASFMERYLKIFEDVLSGINTDRVKESSIDRLDMISGLFHPGFTFLFDYLFRWEEIPGNDNERLVEFLIKKYSIDWVKTAKIEKIENGKTIRLTYKKNYLTLELNNETKEVNLRIDDNRTEKFLIRMENRKLNVYLFNENVRDFIPPIDDQHNTKFRNFFSADLDEFLVWFAGWMGLTLKENWDRQTRREILSKIFPLYKIRGTKKGLEEYLKICTGYTGYGVEIIDEIRPFQVGITSHVGKDTILGGLPPDHFIVNLTIPKSDDSISGNKKMIEELINMEKPVHTNFKLNIKYE
jgi:phage tail-like protein